MHSTISDKGQVTVPKLLRDRLGIKPGDRLDFTEEDGHIIVSKTAGKQDPIGTVYGILSLDESTDELLRRLRGEPDTV
jgi:AbrB family looped-hinge helix DNA binding protein